MLKKSPKRKQVHGVDSPCKAAQAQENLHLQGKKRAGGRKTRFECPEPSQKFRCMDNDAPQRNEFWHAVRVGDGFDVKFDPRGV